MDKELLEKYFNNECTEAELKTVLDWFERSSGTHEGKALLFKLWEELPDEKKIDKINFNLILDKIHHRINLDTTNELLYKTDHNIIRHRKKEYFSKVFSRVAAILLLPVLCFGLYMTQKYQLTLQNQTSINQAYTEIFSSSDAITKVSLPDGSVIWLNHRSSLKYPAVFSSNLRNVELIGEGFFEVAHDSLRPFVVTIGGFQVKALGTTFNIMAYPEEDKIETSLIEGNVELERIKSNGISVPILKMRPTDLAVFQKDNNEISVRTIGDNRYFSWKEGTLVFNKEPLGEVVKKLSRWFNVDIQIKDPQLLDLTYTATFVNETLPQVLELITLMSPVNYSISDRIEISPGNFSKSKVILSYKQNHQLTPKISN